MVRSSFAKRRKKSEDTKGYIIFALVAVLLIAFIGIYFFVQSRHVYLTQDTLCPVDGPYGHTAFLIDRTDTYSKIQIAQIKKNLEQIQLNLPKYSELSIYDIKDNPDDSLSPVFKMCNPGKGSDIGNWEQLASNQDQIKKRYEDAFASKLEKTMDNMLLPNIEDTSPIFQMIKVVSVKAFPMNKTKHGNHLVIISDMLQNSDSHSHYSSKPNIKSFEKNDFYKEVYTDLNKAKVTVLYVWRKSTAEHQDNNHKNFWAGVFTDLFNANKKTKNFFTIIN